MDNSIYVTLSKQIALFRDMDVTANNIANANTTGFNSEHLLFNSYVTKDINQGDRNPMAFANNVATYRNTENGAFKATGNELDVAIQGDGYLMVETPLGRRYTRAGSLQIDGAGQLTTKEGYPVLDAVEQPIIFPEDTTSIKIGEGGNMQVNGEDFATIGVVQFDNPQLLERLNGTLFRSDATPSGATNYRMAQGMLESANVQPMIELTHMMTLTHDVTNTAQFIAVIYDLERKASSTWAQQG